MIKLDVCRNLGVSTYIPALQKVEDDSFPYAKNQEFSHDVSHQVGGTSNSKGWNHHPKLNGGLDVN